MSFGLDEPSKKAKAKETRKGPYRNGAKAIGKRKVVGDCDVGDLLLLADGRKVVVTTWLAGSPFGRELDDDSKEGELSPLDHAMRCTRLKGYR